MIIQYVATAIIVLIIIQLAVKLFQDKIIALKIFIWVTFWSVVLILIWFPGFLGNLGEIFGVGRGVDVLIYISLIFLFYLVFKQNFKIDKLNKEITKLIRTIAKNEKQK